VAGELFAAPMAEQPRRVSELLLGPGQLSAQGVVAFDLDSLRGNRWGNSCVRPTNALNGQVALRDNH
jgi:hypothetical protein